MGIVVAISLGLFLFSGKIIGDKIKEQCNIAQGKYGEETCVDALTEFLNDDKNDFRSRNSAIWALGHLGDSRALPTLEKYYTGIIPQREPLDKGISQYELKKAINLTSGGFNITHFVWRN